MTIDAIYSVIVTAAFSAFLLAFLHAVVRWLLADARRRGKSGWVE